MHFLVPSKTFKKKPQSCVVILKSREKLQSHLVETGVGAEGQVVQVDPTVAGQDALHILVKSHVDLVHENLKIDWPTGIVWNEKIWDALS